VIVQAAPPEHFRFLTERTGYLPGGGFRAIESVDPTGRVCGLVGFDGWTPVAVVMHVALEFPVAARALLGAAFEYAFRQAGKHLALGIVRGANQRCLVLAHRLGFKEVHRTRNGWNTGEDLVHFELRREDCRWLNWRPHG
jgi:RimJ/RimL family protein N-acetyltransferase